MGDGWGPPVAAGACPLCLSSGLGEGDASLAIKVEVEVEVDEPRGQEWESLSRRWVTCPEAGGVAKQCLGCTGSGQRDSTEAASPAQMSLVTWAVGFSVVGPSRGCEGGWGPQKGRVVQGSDGTWGRRAVGHIGMKPWGPGRRKGMGVGSWGFWGSCWGQRAQRGALGPELEARIWRPGERCGAMLGDRGSQACRRGWHLTAALKSAPM